MFVVMFVCIMSVVSSSLSVNMYSVHGGRVAGKNINCICLVFLVEVEGERKNGCANLVAIDA